MTGALADRRILVTGASRGIGGAVARGLAQEGARLTLVARDGAALAAAVEQLPGAGHRALALDVADDASWERAMGEGARTEALHGVVTAAALAEPIGPLGTYSPADFWRTMAVNVLGTLLAIHHALPRLAPGASVVTFGGAGASGPLPHFDAYATSKASVVRLTENLAQPLLERGLRINCVDPGFVATDIHRATLAAGPQRAGGDHHARTARAFAGGGGSPDRAVDLVRFLLAEESAPIAGKLISAHGDPWRDDAFRRRLATERELATLRRHAGGRAAPPLWRRIRHGAARLRGR